MAWQDLTCGIETWGRFVPWYKFVNQLNVKKKIFVLWTMLLCAAATMRAQDSYKVVGQLGGTLGGNLTLMANGPQGPVKLCEAAMTNGTFVFIGRVDSLMPAYVMTDQRQAVATLMLENLEYTIYGGEELFAQKVFKPGIVKGTHVTYRVVGDDGTVWIVKNVQNPDTVTKRIPYATQTTLIDYFSMQIAEIISDHLLPEEIALIDRLDMDNVIEIVIFDQSPLHRNCAGGLL